MPIRARLESETELLLRAGMFMRAAAWVLGLLVAPSRALRASLARTATYRRVDGLDSAQDEPVWDAACTLEANLENDIREMTAYLRSAARKAERAARRRASNAREGALPEPPSGR